MIAPTARRKARRGRPRRPLRPRTVGDGERAIRLLLLVALVALLVRGLVAMPRSVPSESMLPGLLPGDYVLVSRWRYGWSHTSLPFGWPHIAGRLFGRLAARGDVVVFQGQGGSGDYVKRVIGLPGDTVELRHGRLLLNRTMVPRLRVADLVVPLSPGLRCAGPAAPPYGRVPDRGGAACRLPRFTETLPGGRSYAVIDQGETLEDESGPAIVPPGHYFVLGDNRDASADSRMTIEGGGVGMVPADALEGAATTVLLSTDGNASWFAPWTWASALRGGRMGMPVA